ncbi:MAG: NAD+ synthase, partial [Sphingobium sp.]
ALGPERVRCLLLLPGNADDARACAARLGVACDDVPLGAAAAALTAVLGPEGGRSLNGLALRALAAGSGFMPLATLDKTGLSLGRGDACGDFSVVADVYETTVRDLVQWRNGSRPARGLGPAGPVMAERPIDAVAETDLPSHELLDPILYGLVEEDLSVEQLVARGFDRTLLADVEQRLYAAEAARRRSPPGVKIGARSFGRDRRYPITHAFRSGG